MRKKLIKLLCNAHGMATDASLFENASYAEQIIIEADFLISNGVTIQKWIPVTERLPDKDSDYLVMKAFGEQRWCDVTRFAKDGRKVNIYDFERNWKNVWYFYDSEWGYITIDSVTHWMPLPEPPSGERRTNDSR